MADEVTGNSEAPQYDFENGPLKESVEALMKRLGLDKPSNPEEAKAVEQLAAQADAAAGESAESEGEPDAPAGKPEPPKDAQPEPMDWSKFELDPQLEHLYHKSQPVTMDDGSSAFVCPWVEFYTVSQSVTKAGEFITQAINGPEQWQLSALLPNGSGLMTIVFQRTTRRRLPHPVLLETETKVEAPKDPELEATEAAALAWSGDAPVEGAAAAGEAAEQALAGEDFGAVEGADV